MPKYYDESGKIVIAYRITGENQVPKIKSKYGAVPSVPIGNWFVTDIFGHIKYIDNADFRTNYKREMSKNVE